MADTASDADNPFVIVFWTSEPALVDIVAALLQGAGIPYTTKDAIVHEAALTEFLVQASNARRSARLIAKLNPSARRES